MSMHDGRPPRFRTRTPAMVLQAGTGPSAPPPDHPATSGRSTSPAVSPSSAPGGRVPGSAVEQAANAVAGSVVLDSAGKRSRPLTVAQISERNLRKMGKAYRLIRGDVVCLTAHRPNDRAARARYKAMRKQYDRAATQARQVRTMLDWLVVFFECSIPFTLGALFVAVGGPDVAAIMLVTTALTVLNYFHLPFCGHRPSPSAQIPFLASAALAGLTVSHFLGAPAIPIPAAMAGFDPVTLTSVVMAYAAVAALVVGSAVHVLRRQRAKLVGYFLPKRARVEVVFELMQILQTLDRMPDESDDHDCMRELVQEKLARLRTQFRTGALGAGPSVDSGADRRAARRTGRPVARQLRVYRTVVRTGSHHERMAMRSALARLAAATLLSRDGEGLAEDDRAAIRQEWWRTAVRGVRAMVAATVPFGVLVLFRWSGFINGGFPATCLGVGGCDECPAGARRQPVSGRLDLYRRTAGRGAPHW